MIIVYTYKNYGMVNKSSKFYIKLVMGVIRYLVIREIIVYNTKYGKRERNTSNKSANSSSASCGVLEAIPLYLYFF